MVEYSPGKQTIIEMEPKSESMKPDPSRKMILAIDPGSSSGAIAVYNALTECIEEVVKMPKHVSEIGTLFQTLKSKAYLQGLTPEAILEKVGFHREGNSATASVTFGKHVGHLEMALFMLDIPCELVTPKKWQMVTSPNPKDKALRKTHIWDQVNRWYPGLKCFKYAADAVGILRWYLIRRKG